MDISRTEVRGKKVILLNGSRVERSTGKVVHIEAPDKLLLAAQRNPNAVAFGYMAKAGRWVASA